MKINLAKTKEIVFKRPNPRLSVHLAPVANIEQVRAAKLLGVVLCDSLLFDEHVQAVVKTCSQIMYLMKLLRDQFMCGQFTLPSEITSHHVTVNA